MRRYRSDDPDRSAIAQEEHHLIVTPGPRRSTLDLLYTPSGPASGVMDASGERCYGVDELEQLVRDRLPDGDLHHGSSPAETEIMGPRGERLEEGCAVIVGFSPTDDDRGIVAEIWD